MRLTPSQPAINPLQPRGGTTSACICRACAVSRKADDANSSPKSVSRWSEQTPVDTRRDRDAQEVVCRKRVRCAQECRFARGARAARGQDAGGVRESEAIGPYVQ